MKIKCKICNKEVKNIIGLSSHIKYKHKEFSSKDYYDKYLKQNREDRKGICYCGEKTNFYSLGVGYRKYCSYKCRSNSKEVKEKTKKTRFKNNNLKHINEKPLFNFWASKISDFEKVRRYPKDKRFIEVKCKKCKKWFIPNPIALNSRNNKIKQIGDGFYLYCSDDCKQTCSIFHKINYQSNHPIHDENLRPYYNEWSKSVKENANYECERCGSKENLISHHIKPVKTHPLLVADIDNGICVCNDCDKNYFHQIDGCKTGQLARMVC